jgi:hypothetical protein
MCSLCGFVFILSLVHGGLPYGCSWKYISLSRFKRWGPLKKAFDSRRAIVSLILLLSAPIRDNRPALSLSPFLFIHLWLPLHTHTDTGNCSCVCVCVCCQECACVYYRRTIMLLLLLESIPRSLCAAGPPPASIHISLSSLASLFSSYSFILYYYPSSFFLTNTFGSSQK